MSLNWPVVMSGKYHMESQPPRLLKPTMKSSSSPAEVRLIVHDVPYTLDKALLAARSAKLALLFDGSDPQEKGCYVLRDVPADPETFELVARFCHGFEPRISTENVLPLICLASHLEMTETHSSNNLLKLALKFFESRTLPSWNEIIRALRMPEKILLQAARLGLIDACLESIVEQVIIDPRLLRNPMKNGEADDEEEECRPNARRKLFVQDWQSEDLTTLPLHFYELIVKAMKLHGVPLEYVAASLCEYAMRWVCVGLPESEECSGFSSSRTRKSQREAIEAIERLLPEENGLLPCSLLFELLKHSVSLEASFDCRDGLEGRIGRQLDRATIGDLLIPFQGYAKEAKYDVGCVKRILKKFYSSYAASSMPAIARVADLMEDFLATVAADADLEMNTFVSLADMSIAASLGNDRSSDGIYKAIDIYLDKHRFLTESEREEVCRALDCQKMSHEACEHAAQNERLPLRIVVQVLFVVQLKLRDRIAKDVCIGTESRSRMESEEGEGEEELRGEMVRMNNKVMELEKECGVMRKEIEINNGNGNTSKKHKFSMWGEIKRKFGCIGSIHDYKSLVQQKKKKKKVHPPRHHRH